MCHLMTLNQSTKKKNIFQHQWIPSDLAESRQRFFCSSLTFGLLRHRFWVNKKCRCFFLMRTVFFTPRISLGFRFFFRQLLEVRYVETESYGGCCRCSRWWPHPSSCVLIVLRHPAKDRTARESNESVCSQVISAKQLGHFSSLGWYGTGDGQNPVGNGAGKQY